jgi:hypothetical protein
MEMLHKKKLIHFLLLCIGENARDDLPHLLWIIFVSPLHVLKDHLHDLTGITPPAQVLILCDLTDPDRNRDVVLTGRDFDSLFDCGIQDGSFLTLHPLGLPRSTLGHETTPGVNVVDNSLFVETPITPAAADHSYNGVIFDVESKGSYETQILSLSFGGMRGRIVGLHLVYGLTAMIENICSGSSLGITPR